MSGDQTKAEELFGKFLNARRQLRDPLLAYHEARWDYVAGRPKDAVAKLEALAKKLEKGDAAALSCAQLAAWKIASGDSSDARQLATRAMAQAVSPGIRMQAFLCSFASQPKASPAEWQGRAARALPGVGESQLREMAVGYALAFSGDFSAAAAVLKPLYDRIPPSVTGDLSVPLAWSLSQCGKGDDARALLRLFPVPPSSGERVFDFLDLKEAPELRRTLGL